MTTETTNPVEDIIRKKAQNFYSALGNGATAMRIFGEAVQEVVSSRDTTLIARFFDEAIRRDDQQAIGSMRFLCERVWPNCKVQKKKNKDTGKVYVAVTIKGCKASNWAVDRLAKVLEEKLSLRSPTFRQRFKSDEQQKQEEQWDNEAAQKWALNQYRRAKKAGLSLSAMKAALDAVHKAEEAKA